MEWISPIYSSVISLIVGYLVARLRQMKNANKAEREALGALLRNDMFVIYETYRDEEEVPTRFQEEMASLYKAYHGLGFNNLGTKIHDEIMAKKTKV